MSDSKSIPSVSTSNGQTNYNHAEQKLFSDINDNYKGKNAEIAIAVENTSQKVPGMCDGCQQTSLSSVFVEPEFRGLGIAEKLLQSVKNYAIKHVEQIMLSVVDGNVAAIKLYEKQGFKIYGVEPRALKEGTEYRDEILMALILR
ncbi:GNAT family N-acetyltransferase [Providencia sp. 21OH12SH02B-Prov]|uniref:GNAT family N-acetyltransferase n=1 Tax=Providencia sp. 21OH12SH02B-Prov TaxID=3015951 RepID=UPI0022B6C943|nr:GNAT family N-acetyltransferase [Providencia sp. 21OH12SH02B-Prov]WBA55312.1 GNAT family N-acetyltransferase [Providencia sp. 21OH12SH02B-Prov]